MPKLMTLNLNYYVDKHGPWDLRKKSIMSVTEAVQPDIIALQAVAKHPRDYRGKDQALQLCEVLPGFDYHYFQEAQTGPDGLLQGNAVISRLPILEKSFLTLVRIQEHDDPNQRVLLKTTFAGTRGMFDVYNGHFSWVDEQAIMNVQQAADFMGRGHTDALLAGDLNITPDSEAFRPFNKLGLMDTWKMLYGEEEGYTFESDNPSMRIDYFWTSPSLVKEVRELAIVYPPPDSNVQLSDHHGLMLDLA